MAYLGKEFKFQRHEKFDEFLVALGLPQNRIDTILAYKASQKFEKDGDTYTLTLNVYDGLKKLTFTPGVEFDEKVGNTVAKTTFTVDGNTIIQTQKHPDGKIITFKKEFSGDQVVATATCSNWNGVATRYYAA